MAMYAAARLEKKTFIRLMLGQGARKGEREGERERGHLRVIVGLGMRVGVMVPKPRLGLSKPRPGVPDPRLGVSKPRHAVPNPILWVPGPRLGVPKLRLRVPKPKCWAWSPI